MCWGMRNKPFLLRVYGEVSAVQIWVPGSKESRGTKKKLVIKSMKMTRDLENMQTERAGIF